MPALIETKAAASSLRLCYSKREPTSAPSAGYASRFRRSRSLHRSPPETSLRLPCDARHLWPLAHEMTGAARSVPRVCEPEDGHHAGPEICPSPRMRPVEQDMRQVPDHRSTSKKSAEDERCPTSRVSSDTPLPLPHEFATIRRRAFHQSLSRFILFGTHNTGLQRRGRPVAAAPRCRRRRR